MEDILEKEPGEECNLSECRGSKQSSQAERCVCAENMSCVFEAGNARVQGAWGNHTRGVGEPRKGYGEPLCKACISVALSVASTQRPGWHLIATPNQQGEKDT